MIVASRLNALSPDRAFLGVAKTRSPLFHVIESLVEPIAVISSLWGLAMLVADYDFADYLILSVLLFALTYPGKTLSHNKLPSIVRTVLFDWAGLALVIGIFGWGTNTLVRFPAQVLLNWLWLAPTLQLAGHAALRVWAPVLSHGFDKRAVIVGCNDQGRTLASEIESNPMLGITVYGFMDDRNRPRLNVNKEILLGNLKSVAEYVKLHQIDVIYLALPMASQPRILALLDELKDTTASIYFVPDIFLTDLIQARMDSVGRMPVVAVCDTPFSGASGIFKRISDIVLAIVILVLISPLLLVVATAVKFTSSGPVIFKQRRYGLDGREIIVYKFRSMTVCEDGATVTQATRADSRLTPIGGLLRKTSLDELPQFFNVLQGRMSIVGPRPHAVAHNEAYRKLIKGYMVRHKVKPGITGWAQVNGFRGETPTLDKMQARIDYDLEYLRNWSLELDIRIILRTVALVFRDTQAF